MMSGREHSLSNIRGRLKLLEMRIDSEPVVLHMPDGRTEILRGDADYVNDLFSRAIRGDTAPDVGLLGQSISSTEPGSGHLLELARAILNSPTEDS